jgi:hypothetical protein
MAVSYREAIDALQKTNPEAAAAITAYIKTIENPLTLGTDKAFALRDSNGEIRAFKGVVELSEKNGGLIQPVPGGPYVISAQGFDIWAEGAGASCLFPSSVVVNGRQERNPYVERDAGNNRILCIYARAIAFRYSNKGIPQAIDWTTIFDTPSYRMIDLIAKAKKIPQAFKLLPKGITPEGAGTWGQYAFDESMTLWVNSSHEEALSWYSSIINREKKAIDFAQTFARRNALKHLAGVQRVPGQHQSRPISEWRLPVICWRPEPGSVIKWDHTQYAQLVNRVEEMAAGSGAVGGPVDLQSGQEIIGASGDDDVIDAELEPEAVGVVVPGVVADERPGPDSNKPLDGPFDGPFVNRPAAGPFDDPEPADGHGCDAKNFEEMKRVFPLDYALALKQLNIKNPGPGDYTAIFNRVNEILDRQ